jgi:hypothetical protein
VAIPLRKKSNGINPLAAAFLAWSGAVSVCSNGLRVYVKPHRVLAPHGRLVGVHDAQLVCHVVGRLRGRLVDRHGAVDLLTKALVVAALAALSG